MRADQPPAGPVTYTADVVVYGPGPRGPVVLLIQRHKEPYAGDWALPGGKAEPGEEPHQTAVRELAEETGVVVSPEELVLVGRYDRPGRDPRGAYVSDAFLVTLAQLPVARAGSDAARIRWWPVAELVGGELAFDHAAILADAAAVLAREDQPG